MVPQIYYVFKNVEVPILRKWHIYSVPLQSVKDLGRGQQDVK
jgi:hypothetical protein